MHPSGLSHGLLFGVFFLLLACTSDTDRAKEKGFNSVEQMKRLDYLGYKSRADLIEKLPYNIQANSLKFAEAELGQDIEAFGTRKESESGDGVWYETANQVVLEDHGSATKKISKIYYHCSDRFKSGGNASIEGVTCSDSVQSIRAKLGVHRELCTTSYFEIDTVFLVKDNAFFEVHLTRRFGVELYQMGLVSDVNLLSNRSEDPYIDCADAKATIDKARSLGFSSVFNMQLDEEKKKNAPRVYNIHPLNLGYKHKKNPFNIRNSKAIGRVVQTEIFAGSFVDEGVGAKIIDDNFGVFCRMSATNFSKQKIARGYIVIRGILAEESRELGLNECEVVNANSKERWRVDPQLDDYRDLLN